ncbi:MAG: Zn-dependent alcohol dehydrogenase [Candidatus Omnitrophica bacterium]|nr:Zn-dependent alcohol dehydrogenase [Candidatus Omnitrophota bacterium]
MKAKAAIGNGSGGFEIDQIEVTQPEGREVLVRIRAAGVCHTDWDSLSWGRTIVLGHEGAGTIEATGPDVSELKPGDPVILNWAIPCGKCFYCDRGHQVQCENHPEVSPQRTLYQGKPIERSFSLGTMSEYTVVPEEALTKIEVAVPFTSASIVGCGVMTGVGSVLNAAKVTPGSSVAVLGTGGVGLNVIQGARLAGAGMIIAVDVKSEKLEMAKQFGATHTVQADPSDACLLNASEEVKKLTAGRGADYAFECTAIPELGAAPLAMVRHCGTAVQVSGIEQEIAIDMNLFEWDKIYINPLYGKCRPKIDFPRLLTFYRDGRLKLDELVTRTYPLEDLSQAFEDMHHGKNAKGVLLLD